jgi:putative phosphoribosyl transferase
MSDFSQTFEDRGAAGRALAALLLPYAGRDDVTVLGLPRGGVPVAFEVAQALGAELDVLIVRKLGVPYQPEVAMGAIASGGARYINDEVVRAARVSERQLHAVLEQEQQELERRERQYRSGRPPLDIRGRIAIVVDDGLATGASMRVALGALRTLAPARLIAAVPVAPADAGALLAGLADEFVCVLSPQNFGAVGRFYERFGQIDDEGVRSVLARARGGME